MKDEEMAKNYAIEKTYPKFETDGIFVGNRITNFVLREVERAFLAGLNVYKPKWHKLDCEVLKILKENEQLRKMNNEQKETLKKVRVALIQERTANIMNYGKGGVEMFDNMFEILKGVSN